MTIRTLIALTATLAVLAPAAQADNGNESIERVRNAAEHYVAMRVSPTAKVDAASLDTRLQLPACGAPLDAKPSTNAAGANWNIAVTCTAPQPWTLYVPVRVSDTQKVVVLTRNLLVGQTITADALREESRDTATLAFGYVTDPSSAIGKQVSRPLAAGSVLSPDLLVARPVIRRGQMVQIIGRSGGFEVRSQGKALADGAPGAVVAVENTSSRRVVQGTVQDDGSVAVSL